MLDEVLEGESWKGGWHQEGMEAVEVEVRGGGGRGGMAAEGDVGGACREGRCSCLASYWRALAGCGGRNRRHVAGGSSARW